VSEGPAAAAREHQETRVFCIVRRGRLLRLVLRTQPRSGGSVKIRRGRVGRIRTEPEPERCL
jgi:hypothetical protein